MKLQQLLPYDENMILRDRNQRVAILNLLCHLVSDMINAIQAFLNGELEKFDAQVGETSCQIRAHKIVSMKDEGKDQELVDYLPVLQALRERCGFFLNSIK